METARDTYRDIVIRAIGVKRHYGQGDSVTRALDGISLDVYRGEYLSIMGPSGSGKSTLFNMIGGLDSPTEGMVFIDEIDVAQLDSYELAWMRCHKIGYIFQSYNILPVLTALENITLPMVFAGLSADDALEKGVGILKMVGLGDRIFHRPYEMSGGQQQRVAIARAIANDPVIILADEPTANLDVHTGEEIIELLCRLKAERGVTVISATHDMKMLDVSDRILWVRDGKVLRLEERKNLNIRIGGVGETAPAPAGAPPHAGCA
ncbi:MAG: ABC transporter [Lentisphaerae bacterium RIFOXYB12_FULL_65_16]|nr:MAG: ABC transporter [Lentisphaerae bacterium RIFOXYA12_64_32]OGV89263.1 MAG: ABC transporter [Lentisphaerae bacterium RIFOXYB12_FULL_65_16]